MHNNADQWDNSKKRTCCHKTKAEFGPEWQPAAMLHGNGEGKFLMFITIVKAFVTEHIKRVPQNERMRLQCPVTTGEHNVKSLKGLPFK